MKHRREFALDRALHSFLEIPRAGAMILFVAPSAESAARKLRKVWDAINAEPLLRGRYLLDTGAMTIVDRETRAKLRFSEAHWFGLRGEKPEAMLLDELLAADQRKLARCIWPEPACPN